MQSGQNLLYLHTAKPLSYYPHIKFPGITFDSRMTFVKHFEDILGTMHPKISSFKDIGQQKMGTKPHNHFTDLQTVCKTSIRVWDCFYNNGFGPCHKKLQRVENSFIRLALRLPKYVSVRLLHETSGLPYVKERLISVGQNQLARMHVNPLIEHTINSARTNIAWDKYHTPLTILKPQD